MIIQERYNTHYSYVQKLTALLYDQSRHNESKHFCERRLHSYTTNALLERHKRECKGLLKEPIRTELPKDGENVVKYMNYHRQMKAPYVIYADFECLLHKIQGCERSSQDESYTDKTEQHEPCGFAYEVLRSDGESRGPV